MLLGKQLLNSSTNMSQRTFSKSLTTSLEAHQLLNKAFLSLANSVCFVSYSSESSGYKPLEQARMLSKQLV